MKEVKLTVTKKPMTTKIKMVIGIKGSRHYSQQNYNYLRKKPLTSLNGCFLQILYHEIISYSLLLNAYSVVF